MYLFVFSSGFFRQTRDFCHSHGHVTITGERLQIMTNATHLWALSSEDALMCHIYCGTAHPFVLVISKTRDTYTNSRAFGSVAVSTCFNDFGQSLLGFEHPVFRLRGERSKQMRHRRAKLLEVGTNIIFSFKDFIIISFEWRKKSHISKFTTYMKQCLNPNPKRRVLLFSVIIDTILFLTLKTSLSIKSYKQRLCILISPLFLIGVIW